VITHIWESRRFESTYTLQGKLDQQATRISRSVHVWSQIIRISRGQCVATFRLVPTRSKQAPTLKEILATIDRLAQPSPWVTSSFLPHIRLSVGERGLDQVLTQLHRLTGPIYQHVIGTFNTCSRGTTHRSLTDTDGGYNHLRALPGLRLFNLNIASRVSDVEHLSPTHGLLTTRHLPKPMSAPSND
jgi:hypothetical protein